MGNRVAAAKLGVTLLGSTGRYRWVCGMQVGGRLRQTDRWMGGTLTHYLGRLDNEYIGEDGWVS